VAAAEPTGLATRFDDEQWSLHKWRYDAARRAGLNLLEAKLFADSGVDIGELRRLSRLECPPDLIVRLLL
jgi:hypothetical protein